jgi:hypothetical protein
MRTKQLTKKIRYAIDAEGDAVLYALNEAGKWAQFGSCHYSVVSAILNKTIALKDAIPLVRFI